MRIRIITAFLPLLLATLLVSSLEATADPAGLKRVNPGYGASLLVPEDWHEVTGTVEDTAGILGVTFWQDEDGGNSLNMLLMPAGTDGDMLFSMPDTLFQQSIDLFESMMLTLHSEQFAALQELSSGKLSMKVENLRRQKINGRQSVIYEFIVTGFDDPTLIFRVDMLLVKPGDYMATLALTTLHHQDVPWLSQSGAIITPAQIMESVILEEVPSQFKNPSPLAAPTRPDVGPMEFKQIAFANGIRIDIPAHWREVSSSQTQPVFSDMDGTLDLMSLYLKPHSKAFTSLLRDYAPEKREEIKSELQKQLGKTLKEAGLPESARWSLLDVVELDGYGAVMGKLSVIEKDGGESAHIFLYMLPVKSDTVFLVLHLNADDGQLAHRISSSLVLPPEMASGAVPAAEIGMNGGQAMSSEEIAYTITLYVTQALLVLLIFLGLRRLFRKKPKHFQ